GDLSRGCPAGQVERIRRDQLRLRQGDGGRERAHAEVRGRQRRPQRADRVIAARGGTPPLMNPKTLDHVAFWLADRDAVADFAVAHLGMHVIERTDAFTLVGADARRGKLTLFAADGPRERGALEHVALRVGDLEAALEQLPADFAVERRRDGEAYFELGEGIVLGLVEGETDSDYDLDHVALRSADPEATASE